MAGADAFLSDRVRAHDTRAVSSSWVLFNVASLMEIQWAAFWSNPNSFIGCYLKDVLVGEASFASAVLRSSTMGSQGLGSAKGVPKASRYFGVFPFLPFVWGSFLCQSSTLKE